MKRIDGLPQDVPPVSPPARGRGLKQNMIPLSAISFSVAPRAGAWIETAICLQNGWICPVAPRAGAWIETKTNKVRQGAFVVSPPARGRGLKPSVISSADSSKMVAPRAGAWIETWTPKTSSNRCEVAPRAGAWIETLLLDQLFLDDIVAPRAGAWIETTHTIGRISPFYRRPPRGGVD